MAVYGDLGGAGGVAETEATVYDRFGSQQAGQGFAPVAGVLEHLGHQPAQQPPPPVGGMHTDRAHPGHGHDRGRPSRRGRESQVHAVDAGIGDEAPFGLGHPSPRRLQVGRPALVGLALGGIVGRRVEERHAYRRQKRGFLSWA